MLISLEAWLSPRPRSGRATEEEGEDEAQVEQREAKIATVRINTIRCLFLLPGLKDFTMDLHFFPVEIDQASRQYIMWACRL